MTSNELGKATNDELISYFTQGKWGKVVDDDKFYPNELLEDNFLIFYVYVFAYLELPRPTEPQLRIAEFISDRTNPHRLVWSARGISKSLSSQLYVAWRLLRNPNEKILVMSAGSSRAVAYTQFVKKLIALLPITRPLTPRHNQERTSSQSFDVAGSGASDSPSLYAAGVGNSITGMRSSLNIYDDVESHLTVQSNALTEKLEHSIAETHNLLMSGKDESLTLATPHSTSSCYIQWIDNGVVPFVIPAYYPESADNYFGGLAPFIIDRMKVNQNLVGLPIDDRLNAEFLQSKLMRIGKSNFKLQYMLDVSESDGLRYPLKLTDFIVDNVDDDNAPLKTSYSSMPEDMLFTKHYGFKKDRLYKPSHVSSQRADYDYRIMAIDPSGRGRDETGIAIGYHLNSKMFIKKVSGLAGGYDDDTLRQIAEMCKNHKIDTVVVESNWSDGMFNKMLEPYLMRISPKTELDEVRVTGQKEVRIIDTLEPIMNQHRIVLDKNMIDDDINRDKIYSFAYQLSHITKERDSLPHDDLVDVFSILISFMIDKITDDEERGVERFNQDEEDKVRDELMMILGGRHNSSQPLNYGSSF